MVDFAAIEKIIDRYVPIRENLGIIDSVSGHTAIVRPFGASNVLTCQVSPNLVASAGDQCLIVRHKQSPGWIVVSVFSNNRLGNSGVTPNVARHAQGAVRPKNVWYYAGSFSPVTVNSSSYMKAFSMTIQTHADSLLVGFNGTARLTNTAPVESVLYGTVNLDDVDQASRAVSTAPALAARGRATLTDRDASFTLPVKGIPPGTHQVDVMLREDVTTNSTVFTVRPGSFYVMEM